MKGINQEFLKNGFMWRQYVEQRIVINFISTYVCDKIYPNHANFYTVLVFILFGARVVLLCMIMRSANFSSQTFGDDDVPIVTAVEWIILFADEYRII